MLLNIIFLLIEILVFILYWMIELWWLTALVLFCFVCFVDAGPSHRANSLEHEFWDWETFYDY